jgi:hypothetical protein
MALERSTAAVKAHPAGTFAGASGVVAGLLVSWLHLSPDQAGAVVAALGLLTTGISYVAAHGGIVGLWNEVLHGSG